MIIEYLNLEFSQNVFKMENLPEDMNFLKLNDNLNIKLIDFNNMLDGNYFIN